MTEKKHGIRKAGKDKIVHVRAKCDHCHRWECLSEYEDKLHGREFRLQFLECTSCRRKFCLMCQPEGKKRFKCPECGETKSEKLQPFDVYVCNTCVKEWFNNKICGTC